MDLLRVLLHSFFVVVKTNLSLCMVQLCFLFHQKMCLTPCIWYVFEVCICVSLKPLCSYEDFGSFVITIGVCIGLHKHCDHTEGILCGCLAIGIEIITCI